MDNKKPLAQCKNEAERRENYPQLCNIADMVEAAPDPGTMIKAVLYIIAQRRKERGAGEHGTN